MSTIIESVKVLLELDDAGDVYDDQLSLTVENGLQFLRNNNVPLGDVASDSDIEQDGDLEVKDMHIVVEWLRWYCLQRFDRTVAGSEGRVTDLKSFINKEMTNLLFMLKARYDASTRGV